MSPFQQRVVEERAELAAKLEKLSAFILSEAFKLVLDAGSKALLRRQAEAMTVYLEILIARIARFDEPVVALKVEDDWLTTPACPLRNNGDEICEGCQ